MGHGAHMNEPCHTYVRVLSHMRMSHVTYMNDLWHMYEGVMAHMNMIGAVAGRADLRTRLVGSAPIDEISA